MSLKRYDLYMHATVVCIVNATCTCTVLDVLVLFTLQDKTCILWDANKWLFIRQLGYHNSPVTVVMINQLSVSEFNTYLQRTTIANALLELASPYGLLLLFSFSVRGNCCCLYAVGKRCLLHSE